MSTTPVLRPDSATKLAENAPVSGRGEELSSNKHFVRIDAGHPAKEAPSSEPLTPVLSQELGTKTLLESTVSDDRWTRHADAITRREDDWLRLHASELIERLQAWADDLDRREAHLNSRTALLEHRERQLRLQEQNAQCELVAMKSALQREVNEVRAVARRIAFE